MVTIFFSMIILVLVLIENSKNYKGKADSLHQCGKDLSRQYEKLAQIKDQYNLNIEAKKLIENIGMQYIDIINKYTDNHLSIDYDLFVYSNKELCDNKFRAFIMRVGIWIYIRIYFIIAILLPFLLLILFCLKKI